VFLEEFMILTKIRFDNVPIIVSNFGKNYIYSSIIS
jgi:hypothetical protein